MGSREKQFSNLNKKTISIPNIIWKLGKLLDMYLAIAKNHFLIKFQQIRWKIYTKAF